MNIENLTELYYTSKDEFEKEFIRLIKCELHLEGNHITEIIDELCKHIYKYDLFHGEEGYLYCIYNEMYGYYGKNIYNIGITNDIKNLLKNYVNSYINDSKLALKSEKLCNYNMAKNILFNILEQYRYKRNKDFFQCDLSIIEAAIKQIERIFNKEEEPVYFEKPITDIKLYLIKIINENINNLHIDLTVHKIRTDDFIKEEDYNKIRKIFNLVNNNNLVIDIKTKTNKYFDRLNTIF